MSSASQIPFLLPSLGSQAVLCWFFFCTDKNNKKCKPETKNHERTENKENLPKEPGSEELLIEGWSPRTGRGWLSSWECFISFFSALHVISGLVDCPARQDISKRLEAASMRQSLVCLVIILTFSFFSGDTALLLDQKTQLISCEKNGDRSLIHLVFLCTICVQAVLVTSSRFAVQLMITLPLFEVFSMRITRACLFLRTWSRL